MIPEDFKKQEEKILKFWKDQKVFEKSLAQRERAKPFVFFEGPPTANGLPHIGHLLTRIYKDLYGRYKTMRGFFVLRRAGWDTHGLPVEIEVEKELGLKSKKDVESYGIAKFNKKAKSSVWKYKSEWEKMTRRMGFWIDMDNPYITYDAKYIESVWWLIKQIADKKLLYQGHKVLPFCTRCGTALSSHEVAQGYQDITEESVTVKLKIKDQRSKFDGAYILSWTTTPWTLPGNVALAVGEKIIYVEAEKNGERLIAAKDLIKILGEDAKIRHEFPGKNLIGLEYEPPFDIPALKSKNSYKVYSADFVNTEEGTGIVHTAVMYGEEDYELGRRVGLPTHHTVDLQGRFTKDVPQFAGQYVKDAEKGIIDYLRKKNFLFKVEPHLHTYPFCWRCQTPLLYYAKDSWFIRMSALRDKLIKNNRQINWVPSHLKEGRFGEFIKEAKDWALSRERYWGTPLPIWQCQNGNFQFPISNFQTNPKSQKLQPKVKLRVQKGGCGNYLVVGSLADLEKYRFKQPNTYYLLRHGQSTKNAREGGAIVASRLEHDKYELTPKGVQQIKKAAQAVKKKGKLDLILSSPFLRAKQTAQIVADYLGLKPKIDKRLKELDHGSACEGLTSFACLPKDAVVDFDTKRGDGESWRDLKIRMASVIQDLEKKHQGKKILLISHGDPLWMLENLALGLTEKEAIQKHDQDYPQEGELRKIELPNAPRNEEGDFDLHRPYVDDIQLECRNCQGLMKRVPELIDAWFDSGAMPYAQWHYPFENKKMIEGGPPSPRLRRVSASLRQFPADFIAEGIDQTRGWFYTLLAISTALGKGPAYKNLIVNGHTLDEKGQKMSKSKGNMILASDVLEKFGADAVRWYLYTLSAPEDNKPISFKDIETKFNTFFGTLQNTLRFLDLYAGKVKPSGSPKPKTALDQWLFVKLQSLIGEVTRALDNYQPTGASRKIEDFVINDLSNWWIRRSRRRFQHPASQDELIYVASFLRSVLLQLAQVMAPFTPFTAEKMHQELHRPRAEIALPSGTKSQKDSGDMVPKASAMSGTGTGNFGTGTLSVHLHGWPKASNKQQAVSNKLIEEMKEVRNFVALGLAQRKIKQIKVRQPLASISLKRKEKFEAGLEELILDELNVKQVEYDAEQTEEVILDEHLTEQLIREGYAREIIRQIQDMRKEAKYRIDQKVYAAWETKSPDVATAIENFAKEIVEDTLLKEFIRGHQLNLKYDIENEFDLSPQKKIWLGVRK